VILAVFVA